MISVLTSFWSALKAGDLEKDYVKGCYYFLESIAGMMFIGLFALIVIACK